MKLLSLYPPAFREHLGESMLQTFDDLCHERSARSDQGVTRFVAWLFLDTAVGILQEHLRLISPGEIMRTLLKTSATSALLSALLIAPFAVMEVVNRRQFNEGFPFMLFFALWFNLFAMLLILLPILRSRRAGNQATPDAAPAAAGSLFTRPTPAAMIGMTLILIPFVFAWMDSLDWLPLNAWVNGPNPGQFYAPGWLIYLVFISLPVAAGVIAGAPVVRSLRSGGSLFAHPFNLVIVGFLLFTFAAGWTSLVIDQWPCFIGVPVCD